MTFLLYDGTFDGFLNCVFVAYAEAIADARPRDAARHQPDAFATVRRVATDQARAARVWKGLCGRLSADGQAHFYQAFLSEQPARDDHLLAYARRAFDDPRPVEEQLAAPEVLWVAQMGHRVWKEQHRMEAFVRFEQTRAGWYYALVTPDFDVLPLIAPHFAARYTDQTWLIYDGRRRYGLHHDAATGQLERVAYTFVPAAAGASEGAPDQTLPHVSEPLYQALWQSYFTSVNITSRRNLKLHRRMVPARYWRYLTEKRPPGWQPQR